ALVVEQPHRQHKTTVQIAHAQWFATPPIARAKPAFEVHRPHFVAAFCGPYSPPRQHRTGARASLAFLHQIALQKPACQSAHGRNPLGSRKSFSQLLPQLFASPVRTRSARSTQTFAPAKMMHFPSAARPARNIFQSFETPSPIAL